MSRPSLPSWASRVGLLVGSVLLCLGVAEVAARIALPTRYYVWPPGTTRVNDSTDEYLHGVWGPSTFTINAHGMRGDPYDADYRYRLLAVGGSTTICAVLDDAEVWPHLTQALVDAELGPGTAFVGNVGRPGHTTAQHRLQIEKLLDQHPDIDAVVLLAGANDMVIHLNLLRGLISFDGKPDPYRAIHGAFSVVPASADGPWYRRSALANWLASRVAAQRWSDGNPAVGPGGGMFVLQREYRQGTSNFVDELPDLTKALGSYAAKLNEIVDITRSRGVRLIMLTQPSLWRGGLSPEAEARLWFGGPPLNQPQEDGEYFTVRALAEAMAAFNDTLLQVCAEREVECVDVASAMPRDEDLFWDDIHYTEEGSRVLAGLLAEYLLSSEPLAGERQPSGAR